MFFFCPVFVALLLLRSLFCWSLVSRPNTLRAAQRRAYEGGFAVGFGGCVVWSSVVGAVRLVRKKFKLIFAGGF